MATHEKINEDWKIKTILLRNETNKVGTACEEAVVHRRHLSQIGE